MNGRVLPASVGRFEGWLIRVLARPWVWVAAAGVLLIAAAAQAGFDDRFLMSIMIVVPVAFVVQLPRVAAVLVVFAALGWFFPQAEPMPVAAGTGLLVVCGVAAYRLTAPEICLCGALFLVNAVTPFTDDEPGAATYLLFAVVVAALGFGRLLRDRSTIITQHQALATAHLSTVHEHLLLADRTAIARELHDVVAHHISHIAIQAETARYTTPDLPELAGTRFAEIGDSARAALAEMRRILTVIRSPVPAPDGHATGRPEPALEPRPGLDRLDALVAATRGHGGEVTVAVSAAATPIPADTDLVAYRVIQESLTNARRHAPGAEVHITVDHTPDLLCLTIHNGCRGSVGPPTGTGPTTGTGLGLLGMRERVDAVGGTLRHEYLPDGGFTVAVRLPLRPDR